MNFVDKSQRPPVQTIVKLFFTTFDVHELLFDTTNDKSQFLTNNSSSSKLGSDFDLTDIEAEQLHAEVTPEDDDNDTSCDEGSECSEQEDNIEDKHSCVDTLTAYQ